MWPRRSPSAPYERALTLLALAELLATCGDRARTGAALDEARNLLVPLEARPALDRVERLAARLAAVAVRPAPPPPPGCRRARWRCCAWWPRASATPRSPSGSSSARAPSSPT